MGSIASDSSSELRDLAVAANERTLRLVTALASTPADWSSVAMVLAKSVKFVEAWLAFCLAADSCAAGIST